VRVEGLEAVRKMAPPAPPPRPSCLWSIWRVGLVQIVAYEVAHAPDDVGDSLSLAVHPPFLGGPRTARSAARRRLRAAGAP
jgi:hypothetical protein